jgi:hypothetical protein
MKECKIICDLLPSYIDELTTEDTNQYIQQHLGNCRDCKQVLEEMKKDFKTNIIKKDTREVKYIKKYNMKMKILKFILLGILLIFLFSYIRKVIILVGLNNKSNEYTNSSNFYMKTINFTSAAEIMTTLENYKKDGKYIRKIKSLSESSKVSTTEYYNGENLNVYNEIELEKKDGEYVLRKTASLNSDKHVIYEPIIPNVIDIRHPIRFIEMPIFSTISSEKCNGKDCYRIVLYSFGDNDGTIYYIEKETGLLLRSIGVSSMYAKVDGEKYDMITDYQYEFNVVTEEDFIEPDIMEYDIEN